MVARKQVTETMKRVRPIERLRYPILNFKKLPTRYGPFSDQLVMRRREPAGLPREPSGCAGPTS
jgi:hypothetical protein